MNTRKIAEIGINENGSTNIKILDASIPQLEYETRLLEAFHGIIENRLRAKIINENKPKIFKPSGIAMNIVDKTKIN